MESGFARILLVVLTVLGASAVGIYSMAVTSSPVHNEPTGLAQEAYSPSVRGPSPALEGEPQGPGLSDLPGSESEAGGPGEETRAAEKKAPGEQATAGKSSLDKGFDPFMGERFDEAALTPRNAPQEIFPEGTDPQEVARKRDTEKIEAQARKMRGRLSKKVNTIASRMRLDGRLREDLLEIHLEGLGRVSEIRKEFAGVQMTDFDRRYLKDQLRAAYADTTQNIRGLLGNKGFKQFRKESRYYDNPTARIADDVRDLKKQNRQLQKKIDQQSKQKKPRSRKPRRNRRPPGSRR